MLSDGLCGMLLSFESWIDIDDMSLSVAGWIELICGRWVIAAGLLAIVPS
jgi:hypothetical protein